MAVSGATRQKQFADSFHHFFARGFPCGDASGEVINRESGGTELPGGHGAPSAAPAIDDNSLFRIQRGLGFFEKAVFGYCDACGPFQVSLIPLLLGSDIQKLRAIGKMLLCLFDFDWGGSDWLIRL